ncbi:MAG: hypothetical protein HY062_12560 [Bacteroidetes bacterium]|nr:hypothetical protein [Bacteroidota bacterium]
MIFKLLVIFMFAGTFLHAQKPFNTKAYGQLILDGKVTYDGSNEENMFKTLDSLFCKNTREKRFYFKVANRIQQLSDGALGEYFSGIAKKYYFEHNLEFINNIPQLSAQDLKHWLSHIAFDIAADEQDLNQLPKIKNDLDKLVVTCQCNETKQVLIQKLNNDIYKEVNNNLKN